MDITNILEDLNLPQKQAVESTEGPVLILAGAGSGKTKTIVHRIAYLIHSKNVPAYKIMAVTFTNKAMQEMYERTIHIAGEQALSCLIRTYHSLGLYLLRVYATHIGYPSSFTIWDDNDQLGMIKSILATNFAHEFTPAEMKYFSNTISSFKDQLISPEELLTKVDIESYQYPEFLPDIYKMYENQKDKAMAVDFSDLIYKTVRMLQNYPNILEELHRKYHYFMVDEYQDTNQSQYEFIQLLASKLENLCVVGDDDQAIYGWRGANVSNILNFHKKFPTAKIIKLEQNYRSTQSILDVANEIICNNPDRMDKSLWTAKKGGIPPELICVDTDMDEAYNVIRKINSITSEHNLNQIAILYRVNSQSRLLEEALLNNKIPYRVYGGLSFFARKEIKDILAYLKLLANPFDESSFMRIINTPVRGIGDKSIEKIINYREKIFSETKLNVDFITLLKNPKKIEGLSPKIIQATQEFSIMMGDIAEKVSRNMDLIHIFDDVIAKTGLEEIYKEEDKRFNTSRLDNISELKSSLLQYQFNNPEATLIGYLQEISLYSAPEDLQNNADGVQLMTVHSAKGLEFEVIFLLSLDQEIFPSYFAIKEGRIEEERRLLYVAITRAKKKLYMYRTQLRYKFGTKQRTVPSIFLDEIDMDKIKVTKLLSNGNINSSGYQQNYRKKDNWDY